MDKEVREGSRISRLPRSIQPLAVIVREGLVRPLLARAHRETLADFHHVLDGIATKHIDRFRENPRFKAAYARAVQSAGWDYAIPYRIHQALWCSHQAQKIPGDYVEIGTGRGFTMSAVLADFANWENSGRSCHLFDTFSSASVDSGSGRQTGFASPYYAISAEHTAHNFSEWSRVYVNQGDVFETLPKSNIRQIAFLHIDLNFYEPEIFALKSLWDRVARGGAVLLDDYAFNNHDAQYDAMNKLSSELGFEILSTPTGQGIIIK